MSGWFPLTMGEHIMAFVTGATVGPVSEKLRPYQQQYLGRFGEYSDEALIGIVGWAAWKFGGKLSPKVSALGKEYYRTAIVSAGAQAGSNVVRSIIGGGAAAQNGGAIQATVQ